MTHTGPPPECDVQVETPQKCQRNLGNNASSEDGGKDKGKNRQILVVGDSIIRGTERALCQKDPYCQTVCCLPSSRVRDIVNCMDRLLDGAGKDPAVIVHIGTNDNVRGR